MAPTAFVAALAGSFAADPPLIYVYAQRYTATRSWVPISCDGSVVAELSQGRFFAVSPAPGRYTLSPAKGVPRSVEVSAGKEVFLRLDWNYGLDRAPIAVLSVVNPADARREMKFLSYIPARRLHSSLAPHSDPSKPFEPRLLKREEQ